MSRDAFSSCHPAVNALFFGGAFFCGVLIQHPAYLAVGLFSAALYYLLLCGRKGWKRLWKLLLLFLFLTFLNPLINTRGETVLFCLFQRPYTWEALVYGAVVASVTVMMLLWFGCYNQVLTGDKFTALFGDLFPAVSMLLVMVFRMVPNFMRKAGQIAGARSSVGKGIAEGGRAGKKLRHGTTILGALVSWALEGGIVTGDSMRARGYGCARRSCFKLYRMTGHDWCLLGLFAVFWLVLALFSSGGAMEASFLPTITVASLKGVQGLSLAAYWLFLIIPSALQIKESVQWTILRSKI